MLIAGNDNWPANVRVIDDGDGCSNAEHGATAQDNADRSTRLAAMIGNIWVPLSPFANENSRFTAKFATTLRWEQDSVADAGRLIFPVQMPARGTVTGLSCNLQAAGGHGSLPVTMPTLSLLHQLADGSAFTTVATGTDTPGSIGTYQSAHQISLGVLAHAILTTGCYYVQFRGEADGNSAVGLVLRRITLTVTPG